MAMPHGTRRRRPPAFSAELLLVVIGALGILAAVIVALVSWHGG